MLIKMADINGSAKSIELHKLWTECITEEFFQQVSAGAIFYSYSDHLEYPTPLPILSCPLVCTLDTYIACISHRRLDSEEIVHWLKIYVLLY